MSKEVLSKQANQAICHDQHAKARTLQVGQQVFVRNFGSDLLWIPGVLENTLGPVSYLVQVQNTLLWKWHIDHIKQWTGTPNIQPSGTQTREPEEYSFPVMSELSDSENTSPSSSISATPTTRPRHQYPIREWQPHDKWPFDFMLLSHVTIISSIVIFVLYLIMTLLKEEECDAIVKL